MMTKSEQLNAIRNVPNMVFYWLGCRNAIQTQLDESHLTVGDVLEGKGCILTDYYIWLDVYGDNFAYEMGWLENGQER